MCNTYHFERDKVTFKSEKLVYKKQNDEQKRRNVSKPEPKNRVKSHPGWFSVKPDSVSGYVGRIVIVTSTVVRRMVVTICKQSD